MPSFFDHPAFDRPEHDRVRREAEGLDRDLVDQVRRGAGAARLIDLLLHVHQDTRAAWLVSLTGDRDGAVWLPKSQVEVQPRPNHPPLADVTLPEWLAIERRLV